MNEELLLYLRESKIDINKFVENTSNFTCIGTYVTSGNITKEGVQLSFKYSSNQWNINFSENDKVFKTIPVNGLSWCYHFTFIEFSSSIYFFSSHSNILSILSAVITVIQNKMDVPCSDSPHSHYQIIVLMHDKNLAKISELHSSDIETEVSFVKELQPLRIYSVTHGLYVISATVIPYFPTTRNESEKQKLACLFPSNLPEAVFPRYDDNALIQGIRALITKIDSSKAILDVDEEAPLELTKQKMMNEIQKMELQIKLKKEDLIYQMNDKQNPLMENIVKTVSISNSISDSINFNGQYSIPGTDVAAQIRKLAAEIPS